MHPLDDLVFSIAADLEDAAQKAEHERIRVTQQGAMHREIALEGAAASRFRHRRDGRERERRDSAS
jgi:hypothetical protein